MKEIEGSVCCGKTMELDYSLGYNEEIVWKLFSCKECGKFSKIYSSKKMMENEKKDIQEKALVDFWISELGKRGYHVIEDTRYNHHGEVILRALQDDLSSLEMKILGEVNGDQTIIYLQPESCCSLANEYKREPIQLPLIQLPANTKNIKYFDYFPFSWKYPIWGSRKDEPKEGTLKDIWEDRDKPNVLGTYFPKAKTELMEKLANKGFQWEGEEEKDNYLKAICPRCGWTYNFELTKKYMKVEEQKEIKKLIKNHEC